MYIWIYKATEIAAKISQNTRNAWLIWRAYKVALWLEMRLSLPLSVSLCLSVYLWAFLHLSPIALFMTFRLPYFSAVKDIFVWRVASQRLFPPKFHWVFFSSVVVSLLLLSLLCCVVLCGSHLYKQTDYHFMLLLSAEHALLSRCVWLTQRATSDTRQWVKMPMHFHLHCQSRSLSSSPSHCLSVCLSLSVSFAVTSPF